ncbi:unnamed protein product [Amoebophrya sp. A120]|nr:unnamed protein product [Amoebophrya sp. A120]|eukprot:GSA120T00022280001.1
MRTRKGVCLYNNSLPASVALCHQHHFLFLVLLAAAALLVPYSSTSAVVAVLALPPLMSRRGTASRITTTRPPTTSTASAAAAGGDEIIQGAAPPPAGESRPFLQKKSKSRLLRGGVDRSGRRAAQGGRESAPLLQLQEPTFLTLARSDSEFLSSSSTTIETSSRTGGGAIAKRTHYAEQDAAAAARNKRTKNRNASDDVKKIIRENINYNATEQDEDDPAQKLMRLNFLETAISAAASREDVDSRERREPPVGFRVRPVPREYWKASCRRHNDEASCLGEDLVEVLETSMKSINPETSTSTPLYRSNAESCEWVQWNEDASPDVYTCELRVTPRDPPDERGSGEKYLFRSSSRFRQETSALMKSTGRSEAPSFCLAEHTFCEGTAQNQGRRLGLCCAGYECRRYPHYAIMNERQAQSSFPGRTETARRGEIGSAAVEVSGARVRLGVANLVSVHIGRDPTFYIYKAVVPLEAIFIFTCMIYATPVSDVSGRLQLLFGMFLTGFAIQWTILDRLPRVPYLTVLDKFIFMVVVILLTVGLGSCCAFLVWRSEEEGDGEDGSNLYSSSSGSGRRSLSALHKPFDSLASKTDFCFCAFVLSAFAFGHWRLFRAVTRQNDLGNGMYRKWVQGGNWYNAGAEIVIGYRLRLDSSGDQARLYQSKGRPVLPINF